METWRGQLVLHLREQAVGPLHPLLAPFLETLAQILHRQGKDEEAELLSLRSRDIYEHTGSFRVQDQ